MVTLQIPAGALKLDLSVKFENYRLRTWSGSLEMESHRTSSVFPHQHQLGGSSSGELRDGTQLHSHHHNRNRTHRECSPTAQEIRKRRRDLQAANGATSAQQTHHTTRMELHVDSKNYVKLF